MTNRTGFCLAFSKTKPGLLKRHGKIPSGRTITAPVGLTPLSDAKLTPPEQLGLSAITSTCGLRHADRLASAPAHRYPTKHEAVDSPRHKGYSLALQPASRPEPAHPGRQCVIQGSPRWNPVRCIPNEEHTTIAWTAAIPFRNNYGHITMTDGFQFHLQARDLEGPM